MYPKDDAIRYFRDHEGVVKHMYLDVVGLVTIGVGFMLPNAEAALSLNRLVRDTATPATASAKRQDWEAVHAQEKAKVAQTYRPFTHLEMADADIDRELARRLDDFARILGRRFTGFDDFPPKAQIGLLDMIYSLGPKGLFLGFPALCVAVDQKRWKECAQEATRRNVAQARNADLLQLFSNAA